MRHAKDRGERVYDATEEMEHGSFEWIQHGNLGRDNPRMRVEEIEKDRVTSNLPNLDLQLAIVSEQAAFPGATRTGHSRRREKKGRSLVSMRSPMRLP